MNSSFRLEIFGICVYAKSEFWRINIFKLMFPIFGNYSRKNNRTFFDSVKRAVVGI